MKILKLLENFMGFQAKDSQFDQILKTYMLYTMPYKNKTPRLNNRRGVLMLTNTK